MVDERRESEPRQMSGLESSGMQPPGSTQQRAGAGGPGSAMDEARGMAEQAREGAASGLERAADTLEQRATGEGMPAMAAERAAEGMQSAAGYLREHDSAEIWQDVEHYVQRYPVRSLVGAIATGFIVGRILR